MNLVKLITRPKVLFKNDFSKKTFYRFNDILKTELHYQKHFIQNYDYFKNTNNILECHIDIITYDELDVNKLENNNVIKKLIKETLNDTETLMEIQILKPTKKPENDLSNIFLL